MDREKIISETAVFVENTLSDAEGGHDWWHIMRVWNNAKLLLQTETHVDSFIVELAALLHDIADPKFHNGDEDVGPRIAREHLESLDVSDEVIAHVENIIRYMPFKASIHGQVWSSPELEVVQDADRLDAIGAIGIARAFNYGGHKGSALYNPDETPNMNLSKEEYKKSKSSTITHFYEKLFLLKERMNTKTAKKIAADRHKYMEDYIEQFTAEWRGER